MAEITQKKSRVWGWIFVVLLLLQGVVFVSNAINAENMARSRSVGSVVYGSPGLQRSADNYAQAAQNYWVAFGVGTLVCTVGAIWGFWRGRRSS